MKKIILVSLLSVLGIILIGFLVIRFQLIDSKQTTENVKSPDSIVTVDSYKDDAQYTEIEKTFHTKIGTIVDMYGDPIQEQLELYLDPVSGTGADMSAGRLVFKIKENGGFKFFVEILGAYTLSLQDDWYLDKPDNINPIDFRDTKDVYRIIVHNKAHDEEARKKYYRIVEDGDTLWSIAEDNYGDGKYWSVIATANRLDQSNGIPSIQAGDELLLPSLSSRGDLSYLTPEEINSMREAFHSVGFDNKITFTNSDYLYKVEYPGNWIVSKDYPSGNRDGLLSQWSIIGPGYRKEPSGNLWRQSVVNINIYNNSDHKNLNEFVLDKNISQQPIIDVGHFRTKDWGNDGFLVTDGYVTDNEHLLFFKNDLVYDVSFTPFFIAERADATLYQEIKDIVDSFVIED